MDQKPHTDQLTLAAEPRTILGKKVKQLRRLGGVPGIVYGPVVAETVAVTVNAKEFARFYHVNGHSALFTLQWGSGEQTVFIRDVQLDPVKQTAVHVDFFAPNLRVDLTASVPVVLHNADPDAAGILTHDRNEIEVRGLPAAIPHQIDVDIAGLLVVGDSVRVADLTMPEGIVAITAEDELIAHLVAETVEPEPEVEETEAEAVEGDAAAEGGDADAGGETGGAADASS